MKDKQQGPHQKPRVKDKQQGPHQKPGVNPGARENCERGVQCMLISMFDQHTTNTIPNLHFV